MSVQTTVLENGRWVTRNVDPYHVRAQNTEPQRKEQSQPSISLPKTPSLGIFTKALVRSSVINRIIPARIRHETRNDVLFISANSITIKEAKGDYTLEEITTKSDFDSTIKSARIIGERRKHTKHDDNYRELNKTPDWEDDLDGGYAEHHAVPNRQDLPPHILVLALDSNRLVFLCAVSGRTELPEFVSSQKVLPAATSPLQSLGELIAVDPNSRAMAVAAHEGRAYIYALKSMDEMRAEFKEKSRLEPIKAEKLILIEGSILKMEFLHPPEDDSERIILLLVVAKNRRSRLVWYDWNADMPLHQAEWRSNKIPLHSDEQIPLLLIPLVRNAAFILVCEKCIVLIKDILMGHFHRFSHHLALEQEPQEPGASPRRPIWVQWARPMRSKQMRPDRENIILCREDGIVQYMEIDHSIKHIMDSTHNVGKLGVNINTSFATVDLGLYTEDLLVAGGDESNGGLWDFPPRQRNPNQRGVIPNWTPINDFAVANVPIDRQNAGTAAAANNASMGQQRLFACSGRGKHGAISELRYGVEASRKISTVTLDDELKNGVLGIWALHGFYGNEKDKSHKYLKDITYIILSHPLRTYLVRLWLMQDPKPDPKPLDPARDDVGLLEADVGLVGDEAGLDLNARTITVGSTTRGFTIQVTQTSLRATELPQPPLPKDKSIEDIKDEKPDRSQLDTERSPLRYAYSFGDSRILAAYIHSTVVKTVIVLAVQLHDQFYIEFGTFITTYQPQDRRASLKAQPTCLSLLQIDNEILVLVGNLAGELEIYLPSDIGSELPPSDTVIYYTFVGPFGICDSIATIERATMHGTQRLIVCGLRDGTAEILSLDEEAGRYHLTFCEKIAFGHTSVNVSKDKTTNRAIIHCENTICTLHYPKDLDTAPATVLNLWITDPNEPSFQQSKVSTINHIVNSWLPAGSPGFTAESFVCIDGDALHTISLDSQPKMAPRRLKLGGSPVRVLYSSHLDKLIVLYNKFEVLRAARQIDGQRNVPGRRALQPIISFLDPGVDSVNKQDPDAMDIDDMENNSDDRPLIISERGPDERFLGMTEWFPKVGGKEYHMLIINTTLTRAHKPAGRLLLFAITNGKSNQPPKLVKKKIIDTDDPVYSVATYSEVSLVYCCGNDLYMQTLGVTDPPRIALQDRVKTTMRSPGRHVSVREPYIYVSSSRESLSVYRYDAGQLVYQFGDQYARSGLHHLHLPSQSLVLASDMAGTVVGLWQPPERRLDNAMTTVFEAVLPGSITRLRSISRPIWSRGRHEPHDGGIDKLINPFCIEDEIILGSSADGTLTQMSILSSSEWRLLRFLQNMAERNLLICPFHPGNPHKRHIEPSAARPHYMHVNGDILERVLERGGEGLLNDMLDVEPDLESHTDFGSKEDRRKRFEELAKDVLEDVEDGEDGEVPGRVLLWLRYRLRNAL